MIIETINNASFLISGIAFLTLSLLFGDTLLLRFEIRTFIKSLGFLMLAGASFLHLFQINTLLPFWLSALSLVLIYIAFITDPLSKFKLLFPLPLIFFPFLTSHLLLFALSVISTISIFQLVYTTQHRDLIPLGVGFTLISAGEYLYHLKTMENLSSLSAAGSFLYLFASLILLIWVWSYLAIRFFHLIKP